MHPKIADPGCTKKLIVYVASRSTTTGVERLTVVEKGPPGLSGPQTPADVEARGVGQDRLQEHEVGTFRLGELERFGGPVGREDGKAVVGELAREVSPRRGLALDQEDRFAHPARR